MIGDLHCHSICSDGSSTPEELAEFASRVGLTHLAITDHDTMMAINATTEETRRKGITLVPGVECTCTDASRGRSVHMLCYAPKYPDDLQTFLNKTLEKRRASKLKMAELIGRIYPLTVEDVLKASSRSASIHEVHLIAPLAAMGYTSTVCGELLKKLIGKKGSCYVPIEYPDVWETVQAIREAGGLAVMAHPGQFDSLELAAELAQKGLLDGIECFHPRNPENITKDALQLCEDNHLLTTGGSDFHGMYASSPCPLGSYGIQGERLARFMDALE